MKTLRDIRYEIASYTDKSRGPRNHLDLYEQLFVPYRSTASKVFEIGIRHSGSIRMWHDYFSKAVVYGLDIDPKAIKRLADVEGERIKCVKLDQSNKSQLEAFGKNHGPFDIGIDDGSHIWAHQILAFETLWKYINPGGLFIVEDVLTSYPNWLRNSKSASRIDFTQGGVNPIEYFKCLIDEINFNGNDYVHTKVSAYTELQRTIDWVGFRCNSVFIRKRDDA